MYLYSKKKVAILGTVGIPANYGGFETLVENLVKFHDKKVLSVSLTVYCSSKTYPEKNPSYLSAALKYIPLKANGMQSIFYDIWSLFAAIWSRNDVILLLGVSGAVALPFVRFISSARIVTNIDGIEWRRQKWQGLIKHFLRFSEKVAIRFSDVVIADNAAIADYVRKLYDVESHVIAYGGDHALSANAKIVDEMVLPPKYAFSVCRIEPENNVHLIVKAFSCQNSFALVIVGNWNNSEYGKALRTRYASHAHLFLLDPIYDLGKLKTFRLNSDFYVHGHCAGGTNPSLVEAMHFGRPVLAFDCDFNRATTENKALFFSNADELLGSLKTAELLSEKIGLDLFEIAQRRYTWDVVASQYFLLLN